MARSVRNLARPALALLVGLALLWTSAQAGDTAPAKLLNYDIANEMTKLGLQVSFMLGLTPESFPGEDIAKNKSAKPRSEFKANGQTFKLFGGDDTSPPRWATSAKAPKVIAYLAAAPRPEPALEWYRKYREDKATEANFNGPDKMMLILAVAEGGERRIYALFDKIPDDKLLATAMTNALSGDAPTIAVFTAGTTDTKF